MQSDTMNAQIEQKVISAFWKPSRAERAAFELGSAKKRRGCIWRFDSAVLNEAYCRKLRQEEMSVGAITGILKRYGAPEMCYVMSIDPGIDGTENRLADALSRVWCCGPALVSCVHGRLAYLECENEGGRTERYLLVRGIQV